MRNKEKEKLKCLWPSLVIEIIIIALLFVDPSSITTQRLVFYSLILLNILLMCCGIYLLKKYELPYIADMFFFHFVFYYRILLKLLKMYPSIF